MIAPNVRHYRSLRWVGSIGGGLEASSMLSFSPFLCTQPPPPSLYKNYYTAVKFLSSTFIHTKSSKMAIYNVFHPPRLYAFGGNRRCPGNVEGKRLAGRA